MRPTARRLAWAALALVALAGCHRDMWNQPRYKPYAESRLFDDTTSARPLVAGTVPYHSAGRTGPLYTGMVNGTWALEFPMPVTEALVRHGQQRFSIYCAPCHGATGEGNGMIIQRGMAQGPGLRGIKQPPSYHIDRLREMPPGYFFDVITNGFGTMYSYAHRITPEDRWAIAAYVRTLQYSQHAALEDVPPDQRAALDTAPPVAQPAEAKP